MAVRVVPALADVRVVRTWSGVMAFTDDLSPIVGETARLPGYHALIATTGFTLGPLMARLLAEHMASPIPRPLPPAFSPDRGAPSPAYDLRRHAWIATTSPGSGYWPACPTPFHADQSLDLDSLRALLEFYVGEGMHGLLVNGTTGEWFSQTTGRAPAGRRDRGRPGRRPRAGRRRLHRPTPRAR